MNNKSTHPPPWGIIIASFVNKCGSMGMLAIPMLLIEKNFSSNESTLAMGIIKITAPIATFFSGHILEKIGATAVLQLSFIISSISFALISMSNSVITVGFFGALGSISNSLFNPSSRDLIKNISKEGHLRISNSYLRMSSNLGQFVSSLIGMMIAYSGLWILFIFDSLTSFIAFLIGLKVLPRNLVAEGYDRKQEDAEKENAGGVEPGFLFHTILVTCYLFLYELSFIAFSALSKIHLGERGVQGLATVLLINTLICGVMAVPAAKLVTNPKKSIPLGLFFTILAPIIYLRGPNSFVILSLAAFLLTIGEILIAVFSQTLLLQNSHGKKGRILYGRSLAIQHLGRFIAGITLFPLVVHGTSPTQVFLVAGSFGILAFFSTPKSFFEKN